MDMSEEELAREIARNRGINPLTAQKDSFRGRPQRRGIGCGFPTERTQQNNYGKRQYQPGRAIQLRLMNLADYQGNVPPTAQFQPQSDGSEMHNPTQQSSSGHGNLAGVVPENVHGNEFPPLQNQQQMPNTSNVPFSGWFQNNAPQMPTPIYFPYNMQFDPRSFANVASRPRASGPYSHHFHQRMPLASFIPRFRSTLYSLSIAC